MEVMTRCFIEYPTTISLPTPPCNEQNSNYAGILPLYGKIFHFLLLSVSDFQFPSHSISLLEVRLTIYIQCAVKST